MPTPQVLLRAAPDGGRRRPHDPELAARAEELSFAYLGGLAKPVRVGWVPTMSSRWGSCSPVERSIRVSRAVEDMPGWVLDYVLLHELAHLLQPDHGPRFWSLLRGYPKTERAVGFLQGFAAAQCWVVPVDAADVDGLVPAAASA